MNLPLTVVLLLVLLFCLLSLAAFVFLRRPQKPVAPTPPAPVRPTKVPEATYDLREFQPLALINTGSLEYEDQSPEWQSKMLQIGARIAKHKVSKIFFVHGTFVGEDPFDVIRLIKSSFPAGAKLLNHKLMQQFSTKKDSFIKDVGHFTPEYVSLAQKALNHDLKAFRVLWSSGNHHLARLFGAIQLLKILTAPPLDFRKRFLLIGHSHAGQLFAILTQLLVNDEKSEKLLAIVERTGRPIKEIQKQLKMLRRIPIDFVTMGTPPRYEWCLHRHQRLLHLINHRGHNPLGGTLSGILTTRDGDYVQQWGVAGSDALCPIKAHAELNRDLVPLLGAGLNLSLWKREMKKKQRLPHYGHTLLIDYKDQSKTINCLATLFGHGVYTRYNTMLYNMSEIADYFYKDPIA